MSKIFSGTVINGNKIGRRLGFPTANIAVDPADEVANGVYAATVSVGGKAYDAMVNVGMKPTIGGSANRILEAHLFDFGGDLYGKNIRVELGQFIRPEQRFDSLDALRRQIESDRNEIISRIK